MSCLICVVFWIKTSTKWINVNICELHFSSSVTFSTVTSCCFSCAKIYSTVNHLCFQGLLQACASSQHVEEDFIHAESTKYITYCNMPAAVFCWENYHTNSKTHEIYSRKEIALKGKERKTERRERTERRGMHKFQKRENRKGTQAGAICWQWNVSHGEDKREHK